MIGYKEVKDGKFIVISDSLDYNTEWVCNSYERVSMIRNYVYGNILRFIQRHPDYFDKDTTEKVYLYLDVDGLYMRVRNAEDCYYEDLYVLRDILNRVTSDIILMGEWSLLCYEDWFIDIARDIIGDKVDELVLDNGDMIPVKQYIKDGKLGETFLIYNSQERCFESYTKVSYEETHTPTGKVKKMYKEVLHEINGEYYITTFPEIRAVMGKCKNEPIWEV